jgi:hypothetical protein
MLVLVSACDIYPTADTNGYDADKDFLENWEQIDRVLLFDSSWVMSSQWLQVTARPLLSAWTFGDVSCTRHMPFPQEQVD